MSTRRGCDRGPVRGKLRCRGHRLAAWACPAAWVDLPVWAHSKAEQAAPVSRSKPLLVFGRGGEGLDHFRSDVIAVKLVQLRQPKVITRVIGVRCVVCVSP